MRAISYDSVYEMMFLDILEDYLNTDKNMQVGVGTIFYDYFWDGFQTIPLLNQQSSVLLLSSLNVLYAIHLLWYLLFLVNQRVFDYWTQEKNWGIQFMIITKLTIQIALKARRTAENYFMWFLDYKDYYAAAPPTIKKTSNA